MGAHSDENAVDEVDVATAWKGLQANPRTQLVDVRTRAEWTYVGIPDLGPLGKRTVLVEWQTFPDQSVDPRFAERLANELKALGVQ
ncbi:MAG: rhodanese-like domain-containing protein, partial [Methyloceanibacter sp.]